MESLSTNWKRRGLLFTTACSTILIFLSCSFKSSNSPDLSCIKPRYFDQQKWIADSTGADGYRSSMIQKIESDSSFIGRSQFYINCVFSSDYDLHRKIGGKTLIYNWNYNGNQTFLIFEFRRNRVVEVRHFKGCG